MKKILLLLALTLSQLSIANDIVTAVAQSPDLKIQVLKDGRKVLASKAGMTLYTFDNDNAGVSTCFGGCLRVWPIIATKEKTVPAPFTIHVRPTGEKQISLEDKPLYFYTPDTKPGDVKGDGVGGVWHLIEIL